jgi:hypothetical protein
MPLVAPPDPSVPLASTPSAMAFAGAPAAPAQVMPAVALPPTAPLPVAAPPAAVALPAAVAPPSPGAGLAGNAFHSLFHTEDRRGAVSPVVAALWGGKPGQPEPAAPVSAGAPQPPAEAGGSGRAAPLDLFRDMAPNVRALFDGTA